MTGAITQQIDATKILVAAFFPFFAGLGFYLGREDTRGLSDGRRLPAPGSDQGPGRAEPRVCGRDGRAAPLGQTRARPEPMLRDVPQVSVVAAPLGRALAAAEARRGSGTRTALSLAS